MIMINLSRSPALAEWVLYAALNDLRSPLIDTYRRTDEERAEQLAASAFFRTPPRRVLIDRPRLSDARTSEQQALAIALLRFTAAQLRLQQEGAEDRRVLAADRQNRLWDWPGNAVTAINNMLRQQFPEHYVDRDTNLADRLKTYYDGTTTRRTP